MQQLSLKTPDTDSGVQLEKLKKENFELQALVIEQNETIQRLQTQLTFNEEQNVFFKDKNL